jgi:hypothetical protein
MAAPAVINNAINAALGVSIRGRSKKGADGGMDLDGQREGPSRSGKGGKRSSGHVSASFSRHLLPPAPCAGRSLTVSLQSSKPYSAAQRPSANALASTSTSAKVASPDDAGLATTGRKRVKGEKVNMLRDLIRSRYNPAARLLNLEVGSSPLRRMKQRTPWRSAERRQ